MCSRDLRESKKTMEARKIAANYATEEIENKQHDVVRFALSENELSEQELLMVIKKHFKWIFTAPERNSFVPEFEVKIF